MATPPEAAVASYEERAALAAAAVATAQQQAGAVAAAQVTAAYQAAAAQAGAASVAPILAEQGLSSALLAGVAVTELVGFAADGRSLVTLLEQATSPAKLAMIVATTVQDTGRAAAMVQAVASPSTGYVRMLNPPSCSRCVILAGRVYRYSQGFERHPLCDCIHIPSAESRFDDYRVNPSDYFDSLTPEEQDKAFGKAGAEAIRLGSDISQVVNARRGMQKAQVFGREAFTTLEGTTKRGQFRRNAGPSSRRPVRLMPETILALAGDDKAEQLRLLRLYAFIL